MKRQLIHTTAHALTRSLHRAALASATMIALSLAPIAAHAAPQPAMESTGVYVTILSPNPGAAFSGDDKQIEVSAFYQAPQTTGGVSVLELYIDGTKQAEKKLDSPETRGVVSFLIAPGTLTAGNHQIVVRVSAMDAEIASAKTSLSLKGEMTNAQGEAIPLTAPHVFVASPAPEATVSGTVAIKVNANDDSGKPPYVSLFIDHAFKTLRNFPPFDFEWDTTRVANGYHTIEIWGYNDAQMVGHAEPLRILVNNPGGRTQVRHDLSDVVAKPAISNPAISNPAISKSVAIKPLPLKTARTPRRATLSAPVLAPGRTARVAATPQRLADARSETSGLDTATSLMAPFLRPGAPVIAPGAAKPAPPVRTPRRATLAAPVLAAGRAAMVPASPQRLAKARMPVSEVDAATSLMAPFLRSDAHPAPTTVKPVPVALKPVMAAKPIVHFAPVAVKPSPRRMSAPALATTPAAVTAPVRLAEGGLAGDADLTVETHLAAPFLKTSAPIRLSVPAPIKSAPAVHIQAAPKTAPVLSAQAPSLVTATRIASATASDLFTGGSTLRTPALSKTPVAPLPVTHQLMTAASVAASSVRAMLRARGSTQIVLNDRLVSLDKPLAERGSILFAPFRQIFESSGGSLAWLSGTKTVRAISPTKDIQITIGSRDVLINNQPQRLTISPYLQTGRTMVPLSFLPLALDVTVNFDPINGHVVINSKD